MELIGQGAGLDGFAIDDTAQKRRASHNASLFASTGGQYTGRSAKSKNAQAWGWTVSASKEARIAVSSASAEARRLLRTFQSDQHACHPRSIAGIDAAPPNRRIGSICQQLSHPTSSGSISAPRTPSSTCRIPGQSRAWSNLPGRYRRPTSSGRRCASGRMTPPGAGLPSRQGHGQSPSISPTQRAAALSSPSRGHRNGCYLNCARRERITNGGAHGRVGKRIVL